MTFDPPKPTKQNIKSIDKTAQSSLSFPSSWESQKEKDKVYKSIVGCTTIIIAAIWNEIKDFVTKDIYRKHLIWALVYLKVYSTEYIHCHIVGWPDAKTFREKSWHIVECIADLKSKFIVTENRFIGAPKNKRGLSLLSFDCTDCMIDEPWPFDQSLCSKKFNGPGFKYGVSLALFSNNICSGDGPYKAGFPEGSVFKEGVGSRIQENEPVEVDAGIRGDDRLMTPRAAISSQQRKSKCNQRARQETIFGKMKQFNVLNTPFRYSSSDLEEIKYKHGTCFDAVLVITQLKLMIGGEKVFRVKQSDDAQYFMDY